MRVFLIGGTGQIGLETARVLCEREHEVSAIALPPLPKDISLPKGMRLKNGDYRDFSDAQLAEALKGCEGLVMAAGLNENSTVDTPTEETFLKMDVLPMRRLLLVAQQCGVKRVAVAGSCFAYFARMWKEMNLEAQPYVRACVERENLALFFSNGTMSVSIPELPPVVGGGRWSVPVLLPLIKDIVEDPKKSAMPKEGGTALVTVQQAAQAMAGALERGRGGKTYPVGYYNLLWSDLTRMVHEHLQTPDKKIKPLSARAYQAKMKQQAGEAGSGLDPVALIPFRTAEAFLDKRVAVETLGVEEDNLEAALGQMVERCLKILESRSGKQEN